MRRRPPRSTRTSTPFPYTTRCRSGEHELRSLEQEVVLAEVDQAVEPKGVDVRGRDEVSAHVEDRGDPGQGAARPDHESLESGNEADRLGRSEEHTYELQSLMRSSYAVF